MTVALITGASSGLGRAIARTLARDGWTLVVDSRTAARLRSIERELSELTDVVAIPGDVSDPGHRRALAGEVRRQGRLDVLVNNASYLGPSPQPPLDRYPLDELRHVYDVDVIAPLALAQLLVPLLSESGGALVNVTSDAAIESYPGWGGYGSAKAALDRLTAVLAEEHPEMNVYAFDPGDMRTPMHQQAYPGEDISDRPEPETVVPAFLHLIHARPPSGRYRASDLRAATGVPA